MEPHEGQYVQRKSEMPHEPPNDERLTEGRRDGKNKKKRKQRDAETRRDSNGRPVLACDGVHFFTGEPSPNSSPAVGFHRTYRRRPPTSSYLSHSNLP